MLKIENKYVNQMNNLICEFVAEQYILNNEMSVDELNSSIVKARMGFTFLKECLEKMTEVMENSGCARK